MARPQARIRPSQAPPEKRPPPASVPLQSPAPPLGIDRFQRKPAWRARCRSVVRGWARLKLAGSKASGEQGFKRPRSARRHLSQIDAIGEGRGWRRRRHPVGQGQIPAPTGGRAALALGGPAAGSSMLHSQGLPKAGRGPRRNHCRSKGTLWAQQHVRRLHPRLLKRSEGPGARLDPADSPPPNPLMALGVIAQARQQKGEPG